MARVFFGRGARGAIVKRIQSKLGFADKDIDGKYFDQTTNAVKAFQKAHGLEESGAIDEPTWEALMMEPVPPVLDRCLGLTATFEGHGFELAQGNFDGAGVTWGIIGFTLKHGEISKIVKAAFAENPQLVRDCFGDKTDELLAILDKKWGKEQEDWANSVSLGTKKVKLAEPYKSGFAKLGQSALGQRLQLERVRDAYYKPALQTAAKFGIKSEVGTALCFDIHVQNGGVKDAAANVVKAKITANTPEAEVRLLIANAVADNALPEWREDVRNRKVTIAKGMGEVHGLDVGSLKNWGLDEFDVT